MLFLFIVSAVFLATLLLTVAILYPVLTRGSIVQDRLEKLVPVEEEKTQLVPKEQRLQSFLSRLGKKIPLSSDEQLKYTKMLVAAGFRKEFIFIFLGVKILLVLALPAVYVLLYALPQGIALETRSILVAAILAIMGFLLPSYWLSAKVRNRQTEIFHSLPDVLDLLTVCVEAGLSLDAALIRVSDDQQFVNNPLAMELKIASKEVRFGKPRAEALREMGERTMVDDLKAFAAMLIQTERFGTSLSQALRVHSDSLKMMRIQKAEEAAAKTAIKMLFPLAFLIFPALLVVILGPAFMKLMDLFK